MINGDRRGVDPIQLLVGSDRYEPSSQSSRVSADTNRVAGHQHRGTAKVGVNHMKHFKHAPVRAVTAVATFVALVATVGAPFKWAGR